MPATAIATSTPLLLLLASIPALGFAAPAGHGGYSLVHSERASVSLGPRRMEPVPAATATAAPPGCSDLRGELHALALGEEEGQGLVLGCELATQEVHFYSFETLSSHMLAPIKHQFWESSTQVCIHIESDGITNQLTYFGLISVSIPWIWSEVDTDQPNLVQWTSPNVFPSLTRL